MPVQPAGNTVPPQTPGVIPIAPGTPSTPNTPDAPDVRNKKTSKLAVFAIIVAAVFLLITFIGVNSWGLLAFFALLPVLLSGFSVYTTRKDGKAQGRVLAWVAVGITVVALIVGGVDVVRNGLEAKASHDAAEQAAKEAAKAKCDAYSWPTTDLASQLPKPESSKGKIEKDSSSAFYIKVCGTDATAYDNYVKALQEKGFTVDYFKSSSAFNAKNAAGYSVNIRYDSKGDSIMAILILAPDDSSTSSTSGNGATQNNDDSGSGDASHRIQLRRRFQGRDGQLRVADERVRRLHGEVQRRRAPGEHGGRLREDNGQVQRCHEEARRHRREFADHRGAAVLYRGSDPRESATRFGGRLDGAIDARRVFSERFSIRKVRAVAEAKTNKGMPGTLQFRASP